MLSFLSAETIKDGIQTAKTPSQAVDKLSKEIEQTAQLLKNVDFKGEQTLLNTSLFLRRRFDDLKKGGRAELAELVRFSGLQRETWDDLLKQRYGERSR